MVGGIVIEVSEVKGRPEVLFIDCRDRTYAKDTCAIYIEKNDISEQIQIGDSLWWQGRWAMWTPAENRGKTCDCREHDNCSSRFGGDYDIQIPRVGYSGVRHPSREAAA